MKLITFVAADGNPHVGAIVGDGTRVADLAPLRGQRLVRLVGVHCVDRIEIDVAFGDCGADRLDGLDLRPRQPEPRQLVRAGKTNGVVMKRIERREQPCADRGRASGRELLSADDGAQPSVASLSPADARHAGLLKNVRQPRVLRDESCHPGLKVGVGVDERGGGHGHARQYRR